MINVCVLLIIYPLRANHTHATTPYDISTHHIFQLRNNSATTFTSNKPTKLRILIPKDRTGTVKYQKATLRLAMLILRTAKLTIFKVQDGVGFS
jgi:hypothetical protein